MEFVQFNMSVTLSQQYNILADIAEEMAQIYKRSEDLNLMELYYEYTNMGEEVRYLSELVKEQLGEYDWQILESLAVLTDYHVPNGGGGAPPQPPSGCVPSAFECFLNSMICAGAIGLILGCAIFSWGNFWICVWGIGGVAQDVISACIATCCCMGNEICCLANC